VAIPAQQLGISAEMPVRPGKILEVLTKTRRLLP
jgi:hypothetical protein